MLKLVVFDFDGVFTNGKCYFDNSNNAIKYYNVKDGMALSILKNNNIKTGLISSFNTTKNILLNENNINVEIINHLKFDLKYIGNKKKIEILDEWIINLNLNYNEIAYIGDDINDLDIIKKVKFSGCPLDAVDECKNEVNYICKKSGGDGCVREFADKIIELNKKNDDEYEIINKIKNEAIYQLNNFNFGEIYEVIRMIKSSNTIYFTGNTIVDSLEYFKSQSEQKDFYLVTLHRRENRGDKMLRMLNEIKDLSNENKFIIIRHPSIDFMYDFFKGNENVKVIEGVDYQEMVKLLIECKGVISDSGGIQEEAPSLKKPVVVVRKKTERPLLQEWGAGVLVGSERQEIIRIVNRLLDDPVYYRSFGVDSNPYGDGRASERIADFLSTSLAV